MALPNGARAYLLKRVLKTLRFLVMPRPWCFQVDVAQMLHAFLWFATLTRWVGEK